MSLRDVAEASKVGMTADAPVFDEPWQAEAFALVVALADHGVFTWSEWAEALSAQVHRPDAAPDGHDYYDHWLHALESLLAGKGVAPEVEVEALAAAWERAAHATPHGRPIELRNDPQGAATRPAAHSR